MTNGKYQVIKEHNRYTIGVYDEGYDAFIVNDGICQYYWWRKRSDAQAAANAINEYEGEHWLGEHGYGNDKIYIDEDFNPDMYDPEKIELYKLFSAIDFDEDYKELYRHIISRPPIEQAWFNKIELDGIENDYIEPLDDDQAVDEDGEALYRNYLIWINEDESYEYSASEMEKFAKTW